MSPTFAGLQAFRLRTGFVERYAAHTSDGMQATQEVREYSATRGLKDEEALAVGMGREIA